MKRAALVTGVSVAALLCAGLMTAAASPGAADYRRDGAAVPDAKPPAQRPRKAVKKPNKPAEHVATRADDKTPAVPPGPLHVIVSIGNQRVTLFANGAPVAESKISSGTPGHPTPMGVFTVIQKSRHHVSNLYDAKMPYMQRITWSGSALHEGPLPGHPASHGCVRLTTDFAKLLWKATRIGARVIITRDEVAPVAIEHARLSFPKPNIAAPAVDSSNSIRTADAANSLSGVVLPDAARPLVTKPATNAFASEQPTKLSIHVDGATADMAAPERVTVDRVNAAGTPSPIIVDERPAAAPASMSRAPTRRPGPVSVFVSLKEGKLYVRQGMEPLFDAPVTFVHPEQPIGTHVFTAMKAKTADGGMRWTVVSIPSSYKRAVEPKKSDSSKKPRNDKAVKAAELVPAATPSASMALDRLVLPADAAERIGALITPGSSLIVSDNKLSGETGTTTDFIVLTR